ncbi:primosomal protein N' [Sporolactobacillus shoreicorticis]|uniref:Replication restart protein PriA n=1 Tax=Sporolactobacillus shoreicorticis TaxID=1923877 RepID=A0ABW5S2J7_9BACL|nr:primosomal protein N' [Sporolactobacillus shoreicorticis]MCO7127983.1 primosomal protein N' [Sporolactobacillus shoreicorticis]
MIAEVYIDIPANPVNKPFDYRVPEPYRDLLEPGMRVTVPFGRTRRLGFVTALKESSEFTRLKSIDAIEDHLPVLTTELLELGRWLADTTVCATVAAYQAMLPAVLKADYKKVVKVEDPKQLKKQHPNLAGLFESKGQLLWAELVKNDVNLLTSINHALRKGSLSIHQLVRNQATAKHVAVVSASVSAERMKLEYSQLSDRAKRQKEALYYFIHRSDSATFHPTMQALTNEGLSRDAILKLAEKELLRIDQVEQFRNPYKRAIEHTEPLKLTDEQANALAPILQSMDKNEHRVFLCHGVTGSGKTEIYLQSIQHVLERKQQAIVLVPEISLTPQMVVRFKGRFGDHVAVMHSGLSRGEKYDEWRKIREEKVQVVVGARSAIFAPFNNLGLIIIDEEHESSYKQEDMPRYHARDIAIHRAQDHQCPVVLGSATPSLESFARARKQVYTLLSLKQRVNHRPLPSVHIVDLREEMRQGNHSVFSKELLEKIKDRLQKKEQTVLFLNRRGYATFVMCRSCGTVVECPHCDISLTYHRAQHLLKCHYCGYEQAVSDTCPTCGSDAMRFFGTGTQKVEAELSRLIPEARVIRMDVDTTRKKGSHERLLRQFGEEKADILLGTQMIAKGLDFPKVTLVGVLAADSLLHLADFRASEKTFQLVTQVAGRAGRHDLPGEVVIQSYSPDHYAVLDAARHDYESFYNQEMALRRLGSYPPFYYLVLICLTHPEPAKVAEAAERIALILKKHLSDSSQIYGPVVPAVAKIKDRYRYQCMVKYKREPALLPVLHRIMQHFQEGGKNGLQVSIDLNPVALM